MVKIIDGDLITRALNGSFDVIVHGCNCFCKQKSGLAERMVTHFDTDKFDLEHKKLKGNINKLGTIDYKLKYGKKHFVGLKELYPIIVVNAYTQYMYADNHKGGVKNPLDYDALRLCLRKINNIFKGKKIGLPQIGAGLAGGNWNVIKVIIQEELKDCDVTIVYYNKKNESVFSD